MIKAVSALLVGASLLASAPASAADYLKLNFQAQGAYTQVRGALSNATTTYGSGFFEVVLPVAAGGASSATSGPPPISGSQRPYTVTATAEGLSITATQSLIDSANFLTFSSSIFLCGNFSGGIPTQSVAVNSSCSTGRFSTSYNDRSTGTSPRDSFSGEIYSFTVTEFSGTNVTTGVVGVPTFPLAPSVPEPATWAMMLVGFGAIGVALRNRRRRTIATA